MGAIERLREQVEDAVRFYQNHHMDTHAKNLWNAFDFAANVLPRLLGRKAAEAALAERGEERVVVLEERPGDGECAIMVDGMGTGIPLSIVDARYIFGVESEGESLFGSFAIRRLPDEPKPVAVWERPPMLRVGYSPYVCSNCSMGIFPDRLGGKCWNCEALFASTPTPWPGTGGTE